MKKLDQNLAKWLLEWTVAALIVALVIGWVLRSALEPNSRSHQEPRWEMQGNKMVDVKD